MLLVSLPVSSEAWMCQDRPCGKWIELKRKGHPQKRQLRACHHRPEKRELWRHQSLGAPEQGNCLFKPREWMWSPRCAGPQRHRFHSLSGLHALGKNVFSAVVGHSSLHILIMTIMFLMPILLIFYQFIFSVEKEVL